MESKTLEVGKRITEFSRSNPDAKNVPQKLRKEFHEAWIDDQMNGRPRVDYIWKGEPYYSDVNGRGQRVSRNRLKKGAAVSARRTGKSLTLEDYINHPRYKADPKLARAMYEYDQAMLRRQFRFNSKTNQLDHIHPVSEGGVEHYKNKVLTGQADNIRKGAKMPSKAALDYMGIGTTKADMIDQAASSQWPRQTGRDKRTILQGDLDIEYTKGMGPKEFLAWSQNDTARKTAQSAGQSPPPRINAQGLLRQGLKNGLRANLIGTLISHAPDLIEIADIHTNGSISNAVDSAANVVKNSAENLINGVQNGVNGVVDAYASSKPLQGGSNADYGQ